MSSTLLHFGMGARTCIGKNISLLEVYKLVPTLLRRFEVRYALSLSLFFSLIQLRNVAKQRVQSQYEGGKTDMSIGKTTTPRKGMDASQCMVCTTVGFQHYFQAEGDGTTRKENVTEDNKRKHYHHIIKYAF
jgi:hypothetical protein